MNSANRDQKLCGSKIGTVNEAKQYPKLSLTNFKLFIKERELQLFNICISIIYFKFLFYMQINFTLSDISWGCWCNWLHSGGVENDPGSIGVHGGVQCWDRGLYDSNVRSSLVIRRHWNWDLACCDIKSTFGDHTAGVVGVCDHDTCWGKILVRWTPVWKDNSVTLISIN